MPYILIYFTNLALLPILLSCINRLVYDLKLVTFDFYPCYLIIFRFFKTRILGHNIVLTVFMIGKILVPGLKQINAFCCSNIELNVNSLNKICHSENSCKIRLYSVHLHLIKISISLFIIGTGLHN